MFKIDFFCISLFHFRFLNEGKSKVYLQKNSIHFFFDLISSDYQPFLIWKFSTSFSYFRLYDLIPNFLELSFLDFKFI
jgi:hypothetical protein